MMKEVISLERFLRQAMEQGASVRLVPVRARNTDGVEFYAHFMGVNGPTVDYAVKGDTLTPLKRGAG